MRVLRSTHRWWQATVAMLFVVGSIGVAAPSAGAAQGAREVHIGALLSLTGDGATLGTTSKAALEIATQRWNSSRQGKQVKVVLDVENTNLEPEKAQAALTDLAPALADLSAQVQSAVATAGAGKVAVYLAGFEEVAQVLSAARTVTGLDGVRWYGGDGSAQSKALLASGPATFATSAQVKGDPSPLVALPASRVKHDAQLVAQISARAKNPADAFTLAAFDAFNVAARTLAATRTVQDVDVATLRTTFADTANATEGVTGTIALDAAGDRVSTPYAFWSVCSRQRGSARWVDTGRWTHAADPTALGTVHAK